MQASEVVDNSLIMQLGQVSVRNMFIVKDLLKMIEELPDEWGELLLHYFNDKIQEAYRSGKGHIDHAAPTLVALYMFLCGWNRMVPKPMEETKRVLGMQKDPEYDEYCRLMEKFSKWEAKQS